MRLSAFAALIASASAGLIGNVGSNLVKNGDFTKNFIGSEHWAIGTSLPGWEVFPEVEVGYGTVYNNNWGDRIVVELDSNQNDVLKQVFDLECQEYTLQLDYAARTGHIQSSAMCISWNGRKIKTITGEDDEIHTLRVPLTAVEGKNTLEIAGEGTSDSYGMTINGVQLSRNFEASQFFKKPNNIKDRFNLVKNGDFSKNFIGSEHWAIGTSLPGWEVFPEVEVGYGTVYNNNWGDRIVVELDSNQNDVLKQVFDLECQEYTLQLDYAARTGHIQSSAMCISWNGRKIKTITGEDDAVHTLEISLSALQGNNILEIAGQGISDSYGMTIANVRLFLAESKFFGHRIEIPQIPQVTQITQIFKELGKSPYSHYNK